MQRVGSILLLYSYFNLQEIFFESCAIFFGLETDEDGRTPLHWASGSGKLAVIQVLLEMGANPNARDESQWTPLICAASAGHTEVVKLLLLKNADVNALSDTKRCVFSVCVCIYICVV
jgi:ankyrin repeat protein